jgi:hypothetical protein
VSNRRDLLVLAWKTKAIPLHAFLAFGGILKVKNGSILHTCSLMGVVPVSSIHLSLGNGNIGEEIP